ncbi:FadR/GntR family transcriptional regulator [Phenylobacterium sp. LjRoot225]|uniref:FadR/GntR family transcriptional regulator n=1 Tax=Phenylobacterium sp. LjRoot225 TaxID=3342285 RepID=UPI003ECEDD8A
MSGLPVKPAIASDSRALLSAAQGEEPGERLADRVYGQLLAFILEQNLDQGDRLPSEHELSRLTAVSRPIVREALTRLQGDGLIESRRGAGSFVRQRPAERMIQHLLPAQVRARLDTFEIRIAVEPVAARLAALHRTESELLAIKAATADLVAALAAGEPAGDHDLHFHRAIAEASHNPMFRLTLDALDARVEGLIVPSLALAADGAKERAKRVELEHVVVAEAIERGEPEVAEAAMRLHLLRARSRAIAMRW